MSWPDLAQTWHVPGGPCRRLGGRAMPGAWPVHSALPLLLLRFTYLGYIYRMYFTWRRNKLLKFSFSTQLVISF